MKNIKFDAFRVFVDALVECQKKQLLGPRNFGDFGGIVSRSRSANRERNLGFLLIFSYPFQLLEYLFWLGIPGNTPASMKKKERPV